MGVIREMSKGGYRVIVKKWANMHEKGVKRGKKGLKKGLKMA